MSIERCLGLSGERTDKGNLGDYVSSPPDKWYIPPVPFLPAPMYRGESRRVGTCSRLVGVPPVPIRRGYSRGRDLWGCVSSPPDKGDLGGCRS